ncbi:Hint domain-containing protein [Phaeobacter sp. C3_T13_0]|uniref:Hint domain-containing protein n=1 Tax=Phaeobacter cretensis TaxID=3342641 RepID=UPI0039BCFB53
MPIGYLVVLGDGILDAGDVISGTQSTFDSVGTVGTGSWTWTGIYEGNGQFYSNVTDTGSYYIATDGNTYFVPDTWMTTSGTASSTTIPSNVIAGTTGVDNLAGTGGDDAIYGGDSNDTLNGDSGNDTLSGGDGWDQITGGAGNDYLDGGAGNDHLDGGADKDTFFFSDGFGNDTVVGGETVTTGPDDDVLNFEAVTGPVTVTMTGTETGTATSGSDSVAFSQIEGVRLSSTGDDLYDGTADTGGMYVLGGGGDDTLLGGSGYDDLRGGDGNDSIVGGDYSANLEGGDGNDTVIGGADDDQVVGNAGDDYVDAGAGNDYIAGYQGADTLVAGAGNDDLEFSSDGDVDVLVLDDGFGNDNVFLFEGPVPVGGGGFTSIDQLDTSNLHDANGYPVTVNDVTVTDNGSGNAVLTFPNGESLTFFGISPATMSDPAALNAMGIPYSDDIVEGTSGGELIDGSYVGDPDGDMVDALDNLAGDNDDVIHAGAGDDTITGQSGDDLIYAQDGADIVDGGVGNDSIDLGSDSDRDTLVTTNLSGSDVVTNFDMTDFGDGTTIDQIDVSTLIDGGGNPIDAWDVVVTDTNGDGTGDAILTFPNGETLTLKGVLPSQVDSASKLNAVGIPCFTSGTMIATPLGGIAVEALCAGDLVTTLEHGPKPVRWIGSSDLGNGSAPLPKNMVPVRIKPGAMRNHLPLSVSPQHCILMTDNQKGGHFYVRAKHLAEETRLASYARKRKYVTYFHVLLDQHATLISNGIPCESFYPGPIGLEMLSAFNRVKLHSLIPGLTLKSVEKIYGPRAAPVLKRRKVLEMAKNGTLDCFHADFMLRDF